jgi:hypothetical protein
MLWTPTSTFNNSASAYGIAITDVGFGVNVPGHANANQKGANTQLVAGLAEDCYGISIGFSGGNASTVIRRAMVDLLIDPAAGLGGAGSSWSVIIANLYVNSAALGVGCFGYWYYFPLYLKAGTAIGAAHQSVAAGTVALRMGIKLHGKPSKPELLRYGTRVQTIGATTASTTGVAVTPGTGAYGSYSASLGTLDRDAWWWQLGIGSADTTMTANGYLFDVAVNATNKLFCMEDVPYSVSSTIEIASMASQGPSPPIRDVQSGEDVYVRAAAVAAPDTSMTAIVYALS